MANQKSEMRDRYPGWPDLPHYPTFHAGPQPFGLAAHHTEGASKSIVPSTRNEELAGTTFYVRDKAILRLNDPYVSITTQDFRPFTEKQLQGYARKDDWKQNSQARDAYPLIKVPGPMLDACKFRLPTRVPRLAPNTTAVPHRGLRSLAQESYQLPNDHRRTRDRFCPVQRPPTVSHKMPMVEIMCVPGMYETEYKNYGSSKPMPL